ncbi:MAG: acylphosphatase [Chitinophagaceae bacterium]|nr:acylphosphatase [Chitinophagaceae bacterium]
MPKTVSIIVTGKVQGVFYRQSAKETASLLDITGEVRNMPDGSVHIIATGNHDQLKKLIQWCKQGPPRARVDDVVIKELSLDLFEKFSIVR